MFGALSGCKHLRIVDTHSEQWFATYDQLTYKFCENFSSSPGILESLHLVAHLQLSAVSCSSSAMSLYRILHHQTISCQSPICGSFLVPHTCSRLFRQFLGSYLWNHRSFESGGQTHDTNGHRTLLQFRCTRWMCRKMSLCPTSHIYMNPEQSAMEYLR